MFQFLNNLFRGFRTTSTARGGKRAARRAVLRLEGLEDRLVLTTASQIGSTLLINNIALNHDILLQSTGFNNGFRGLQIIDNGVLQDPQPFNISSINTVKITVSGGDSVSSMTATACRSPRIVASP